MDDIDPSTPQGVAFAFGPGNGIFFEAGGFRYWHNIPDGLMKIYGHMNFTFSSWFLPEEEKSNTEGVKRTICVGLNADGGYAVAYERNDGEYISVCEGCPEGFTKFALQNMRTPEVFPQSLSFAFGPKYNTFFARGEDMDDEAYRYRWNDIPPEAEEHLQYRTAVGVHHHRWTATLGANGSFIIFPEGAGRGRTCISGVPEALRILLDKTNDHDDAVIVLNPFVPDQFFAYLNDGSMRWNIDRFHGGEVQELAQRFAKERSQEGLLDKK